VLSAFYSTGDRLTILFLLFTLYGLYLLTIIILALLMETFTDRQNHTQISMRQQIKEAIESLAHRYRGEPISYQNLLVKLRTEAFPHNPQSINHDILSDLLQEMNKEIEDAPKITIIYDAEAKVIPRWRPEYDQMIIDAEPRILVLLTSWSTTDLQSAIKSLGIMSVLQAHLAKSTNLSLHLIKEKEWTWIYQKYEEYNVVSYPNDQSWHHALIAVQSDIREDLEQFKFMHSDTVLEEAEQFFKKHTFSNPASLPIHKIIFFLFGGQKRIEERVTVNMVLTYLQQGFCTAQEIGELICESQFSALSVSEDMYDLLLEYTKRSVWIKLLSLGEEGVLRMIDDGDIDFYERRWELRNGKGS
jgi:hypothetical protein